MSRRPAPPAVPASPLQRAARAAGSLALLAGLTAGLPLALVRFAGKPLPAGVPTMDDLGSALTSPDDGTLFLGVLAVVGWLAWACFTGTVVVELAARLVRRPPPTIPGLRGPQRVASVLVAAVAALTVTPTLTSTSAAVVDASPAATAALAIPVDLPSEVDRKPDRPLHLVTRGEGMLDLQDRYGVPWQRIAEANYGAAQPDGRSLQRGQTRIYPGWQLRIPTAATPVDTGEPVDQEEPVNPQEYEVVKGDWMWHVADRYLGDPERYGDIAALNPQYADRHGDFPDHIEPGWTLTLPEDAVDSGPIRHATGAAAGAAAQPDPPDPPDSPAIAEPAEPAQPAEPATVAGFGAAPEKAQAAEAAGEPRAGFGEAPEAPGGDRFDAAEPDPERLAPAALAGAGLLTALVLGAAALHRHRRHQHHRPGFRFTSPSARRLEKALRAAQQPLDTARLDAALRNLAAGLADRTDRMPDIAGAMVDEGSVHLLLGSRCPDPPPPWQTHGDRWTLPAGTALPPPGAPQAPLAPLPTLAAIGSQAGIHLLLDLERLGFLTVYGDPGRALDLLRYLAAELACNSWSDTAEILLTGFPPAETEQLVAVNPDRVRAVPTVPDAVVLLRQRIASARATLGHTGVPDALTGRLRGVAGDAWMPQILVATGASPTDLAALSELEQELDGAARCAVAVATTDATPPAPDQWRVTVTPDGVVHVRLPFLGASLAASALSVEELAPLAETMRAARAAVPPVPVPPAPEPYPWAAGTDAAGAVQPFGPGLARRAEADPDLDDDLREWLAAESGRPRIGILGPVSVDAPGPVPETRRRLHAELIVFLAQRAGRGADAGQIDAALWPDTRVADPTRQRTISRARHWLGTGPGGAPWLPDLGPDLRYRLADGFLLDWHLFRRLRTRGETRGTDGAADLRAAIALVRGMPLDGADRPTAPGTRNPYPWLAESDIHPDHLVAAIVDTAHQLAELCLAAGDPAGARWAVQQAWLADPARGYDQPWRDLLRAEHADGQTDRLRAVLAELMEVRDAEAAEDLAPDTYGLISCWPPNVLVPTG